MATDFEIAVFNRPGTLATATAALGDAGINIDGQCAYVCDGQGVYHILVRDATQLTKILGRLQALNGMLQVERRGQAG